MELELLSNLIITNIYSAITMYTEKNSKPRRTNRNNWAVVIKYEGETVYNCNGKTYISNINNIVILPKGSSYEWRCTHSGHFLIIDFESELTHDNIFSIPVKNGEKFLKLFKELEYKIIIKKPLYTIECIRDIYSIILALTQSAHKKFIPSEKLSKISPAINYIAKNYNTNITNDTLVKLTGISSAYFRKLFAEAYGISPMAYVHTLRINKAKEMLKSDYGSISDIAETLGYPNIYDFSRTFKKYTGVSPTVYEKRLHI